MIVDPIGVYSHCLPQTGAGGESLGDFVRAHYQFLWVILGEVAKALQFLDVHFIPPYLLGVRVGRHTLRSDSRGIRGRKGDSRRRG